MTTQPEALRLADAIDPFVRQAAPDHLTSKVAAAELRRLHEVNQEWERKAATWLASPEAAQRLDGYRELAQRVNALETLNQELLEALKKMNRAYVNLLQDGRDRIVMLGGLCDPVDVMEANNPDLRECRAAIAKATGESK